MQVEVPESRVTLIMAEKLANSELQCARLAAVNEVLTGRLQEYEKRDLQSKAPGSVGLNDQPATG